MDSITQMALGAAVGEAALGKQAGGKAALWGGVLGTLPDLDVLAYPLLDPAQELLFHRGPTHALLFSVVSAPLFGCLLARVHWKDGVGWKGWSWLVFLALVSHPILDSLTAYGTQLLLPFSRVPVAFSTISIIDPIYTFPLAAGVVAALFCRQGTRRRSVLNGAGLVISSCYLLFTVANKLHVSTIFESELQRQGIEYRRLEVMPSLFNNILWTGLAADEDEVFAGLYSHLDEDQAISFRRIPTNAHLLPSARRGDALSVLFWFSRGLFTVEADSSGLFFDDLHIGRTDFFMRDEGESIFSFRLELDDAGNVAGFEVRQPGFENRAELLDAFFRRISGEEGVQDSLGSVRLRDGSPEQIMESSRIGLESVQ